MKLALTIEYSVDNYILPDSQDVVFSYKDRSHSVSPKAGCTRLRSVTANRLLSLS